MTRLRSHFLISTRSVGFLALLLFVSSASAVDYYWYTAGNSSVQFSDPLAACSALAEGSTVLRPYSAIFVTETRLECQNQRISDGALYGYLSVYVRAGDGCPDGTTYNSQTGRCEGPEPDKCEPTIGLKISHEHKYGALGGEKTDPPSVVCESACQYSNTWANQSCRRGVSETDRGAGYCSFTYQGNGVSCTESTDPQTGESVFDQPPTLPPMDKTPVYNKDNLCGDWSTTADGTATRTCTGTETFVEPGQLNCNNNVGIVDCTPGTPTPEVSETKVTETTEKKTNADGSTDTNTSKTTDKTSCKGIKPCTSTSKTETTESGTNPDGTPGNESTECTGDHCKPGDEGEGEDEEETEEPERSADAGACDGSFSCEGDPINCAILKKQKEQQCFAEDQADFEGHKNEIEGLVQGDKFELDEGAGDIDVPGFINKGTRFLPASCPPEESMNLVTAGGHTFKLSYEPLCRAASDLGNLFVAFAIVFAALYVGRSVGGS